MDKDLDDDTVKLVRYKILFVKPEHECAFPEEEELVSDSMDASVYAAWKIAEFMQKLTNGEIAVPNKWMERGYPGSEHIRAGKLIGLHQEDKKYLRVYHEVLERYQIEKSNYEEEQIRVIKNIHDALD